MLLIKREFSDVDRSVFRSDPDKDTQGWGENDRGVSFTFGADVVAKVREGKTDVHELSFDVCLLPSSSSIDTIWI